MIGKDADHADTADYVDNDDHGGGGGGGGGSVAIATSRHSITIYHPPQEKMTSTITRSAKCQFQIVG